MNPLFKLKQGRWSPKNRQPEELEMIKDVTHVHIILDFPDL